MENNEMNQVIVKQKSNKGVIIVLIILLVGALGYIAYDKFIAKDTTPTISNESNNTTTNDTTTKDDNVPITDLVTYVNDGTDYFYGYIKEGNLYYSYGKNNTANFLPYENTIEKCEKVQNIKRIKVFKYDNTAVVPKIYLITNEGNTYSVDITVNGIDFTIDEKLKEYKVEDIEKVEPYKNIEIKLQDGTTTEINW